ncbi:diguanylate cyclase [Neptuniibacter sp.]|uniref:diguanylate cyclase n=1 Tax=Neptuniibacter sp. TaxID=1962643 RepID=UPI0026217E9C|nr:diguanylate cyclase [Neptuniibacter sp.]
MKTSTAKDIAQSQVIKVREDDSIRCAVELMYRENHRDVIVESTNNDHRFGLLTASDLIRLKVLQVDFSQPIKSIKYDRVFSISEDTPLEEILEEVNHEVECLCTTDQRGELTGVVFYADIISSIDPQALLEKRMISEIILNQHIKKAQVTDETINVISLMDHHLNDCVLLYDNNEPVGIITTKDIIKLFGEKLDLQLPISKYMSTPVETIRYNTSIKNALDFIRRKNFKRLIVEDRNATVIGQITQGELISRVYSRWTDMVRDNDDHLKKLNKELKSRATKFEELSIVDHLTGIYNRAKFEFELQKEINRVERYKTETFSIVFLDIDHFKQVNDKHGHAVGDIVLQQVSRHMQNQMRLTDVFARWGGEEFVVLLPSTCLEDGYVVAEKLRKSVNELPLEGVGSVSCSFGVAAFSEGDTFHTVILRADQATYKAKANGRNRVEVSTV